MDFTDSPSGADLTQRTPERGSMDSLADLQTESAKTTKPREVREVKIRLPTEQVLRLHLTRMTKGTSVSTIVSTALTRYFAELANTP